MQHLMCQAPECTEDARVKEHCMRHYSRLHEGRQLEVIAQKCRTCGAEVPRSTSGPTSITCSQECKAVYRATLPTRPKKPSKRALGALICQHPSCYEMAAPKSVKWCAVHQAERAILRKRSGRDSSTLVCGEPGCDRPVRARACCNMHYKRILSAEGRFTNGPRSDKKRDSDHRRRARMFGAGTGGSVFLSDIVARDGTNCKLCSTPVDMALTYPSPFSKSVDHIVPLSRGGAHSASNCQLAHLRCNISKGAKAA